MYLPSSTRIAKTIAPEATSDNADEQPEHPVVEQRVQQHQRQADRTRDQAGPQRRQTQCGRDGFGLRGLE